MTTPRALRVRLFNPEEDAIHREGLRLESSSETAAPPASPRGPRRSGGRAEVVEASGGILVWRPEP